MKKIITRFPPSPTGHLHVGGLRTALYNFLFAKKNKGKFYLRIEDTDQSRKIENADKQIIEILEKLGLKRDNKKVIYQSQRLDIYKRYAEQLIESGHAYYCFCTQDNLNKIREQQKSDKQPPGYWGKHRKCNQLTDEEVKTKLANNEPYVIRFKILPASNKPDTNQQLASWKDEIHGNIAVDMEHQDDFVMIKTDGYPTYNYANVIDDHDMKISHVIRGEEFLSSTIKHINLYKALNWDLPIFAHLPLLLNPDKSKLSKRQGDVAVEDYLQKGYLPEALINFVALLGWNPGAGSTQEIFSIKDLIKSFDLAKINKSGAVFDIEKLDWLNGLYIRKMKIEDLTNQCQIYLKDIPDKKLLDKIIIIEQERLKKLSDISQNIDFFYKDITYKPELLIWKKANKEQTLENLVQLEDYIMSQLNKANFEKPGLIEDKIIKWIKQNNYGVGDILWPMRVALSGQQNSPSPFEIAWVLGKEKTLERINQAQQKLK